MPPPAKGLPHAFHVTVLQAKVCAESVHRSDHGHEGRGGGGALVALERCRAVVTPDIVARGDRPDAIFLWVVFVAEAVQGFGGAGNRLAGPGGQRSLGELLDFEYVAGAVRRTGDAYCAAHPAGCTVSSARKPGRARRTLGSRGGHLAVHSQEAPFM